MRTLGAVAVATLVFSAAADGQGPPAPAAPPAPAGSATVGFMHAIHATENVEKTMAFYTELFGLATKIQPFANEAVPLLTDSPGASLRIAMLRVPGEGLGFELTEFSNVTRNGAQPRVTDPGAPHMKLLVADLEPVVAAAKRIGATIVTTGGAPVTIQTASGPQRALLLRDPDGYLVMALQAGKGSAPAPAPPAPGAAPGQAATPSNVVGAIMGETVSSMDTAMGFWRDMLSFQVKVDERWSSDKAMLDLYGLPAGTEYRLATGVVPGSRARMEFIEFRGTGAAKRTPFSLRVPDPGSSGMAIRVADIEGLVERMRKAGVRILSAKGQLVTWSPTVKNIFVKDPDGFNIELVGNVPAAK